MCAWPTATFFFSLRRGLRAAPFVAVLAAVFAAVFAAVLAAAMIFS
jgi:hypothetical protein